MKQLLIATSNPGKLEEIRHFLSNSPIELVSLKDLDIKEFPHETGKTFAENAILKAKFYCKKSGLPTLADDGGFEIDALRGEPGVKSHRWIDPNREASDQELIDYTLQQVAGLPLEKRGAQLRLVLALALPSGEVFTTEAKVRGIVANRASSNLVPGFPYRALLFLPEINKYYDHKFLTHEETERYNHRKQALDKLKPVIREFIKL